MGNLFDDILKERLKEEKFFIPESYDAAVERTIQKIEKDKKINLWNWVAEHKAISAAVLFLALVSTSVSAMAAMSAWQKRMQRVPEKVIEKYNEDVQKVQADADSFSRELSETEENEFVRLREAYEKGLKFPEREMLQVENGTDIPESGLCFAANESKFYLPKEELTEEEILEIIDLQEKRDYSVTKKNQVKDADAFDADASIETSAKQAVQRVYEADENALAFLESHALDDGEKELLLADKKRHFSVFLTKAGIVERIISEEDGVEAHKEYSDIANLPWRKIAKLAERRTNLFTGKNIEKKSAYSVMDGRKSVKGTVSFFCELSDGTGCVAVYSIARNEIYDIYTERVDVMKKDIKERKENARKAGFSYKKINASHLSYELLRNSGMSKKHGHIYEKIKTAWQDEDWRIEKNVVYFGRKEMHRINGNENEDGVCDLSIVDEDTVFAGYFSGDGKISIDSTQDGGKTWRTSSLSYEKYGGIGTVHLSFFNKEQGYILYCSDPAAGLENEVLFYTDNGAETFQKREDLSAKIENYVTDMAFLDMDTGIILVSYHGHDAYAYQTKDKGVHWKSMELCKKEKEKYINGVSVYKDRTGNKWVLSLQMVTKDKTYEEIYVSRDFWKNWTKEPQ